MQVGGRFVFVVGHLSFCIDFPPGGQRNAFVVGVPVQIFDHWIAVHDKAQNPVGFPHGLEHSDFSFTHREQTACGEYRTIR